MNIWKTFHLKANEYYFSFLLIIVDFLSSTIIIGQSKFVFTGGSVDRLIHSICRQGKWCFLKWSCHGPSGHATPGSPCWIYLHSVCGHLTEYPCRLTLSMASMILPCFSCKGQNVSDLYALPLPLGTFFLHCHSQTLLMLSALFHNTFFLRVASWKPYYFFYATKCQRICIMVLWEIWRKRELKNTFILIHNIF